MPSGEKSRKYLDKKTKKTTRYDPTKKFVAYAEAIIEIRIFFLH